MIRKYNEWVKESEKMEAQSSPLAGASTDSGVPQGNEIPLEEPAAETEPIQEPSSSTEATPSEETPSEFESNIEEWRSLDSARKDAIKEFKKKQEEFLQIPDEIRNNPVEETDKTKVETMKSELTVLHKTMKDAIREWDSFNAKTLGLEDETDPDYEP